jgi:sulfite reductase alpha subunit-like flavoprotein
MKSSESAKNSSLVQLNSSSSHTNNNNNNHPQFQPIHQQPLVNSNGTKIVFDAGKVNATATHIELEQQSNNCNITTILNMSCRGRAEAFARSLQSRLRTLGSQVSFFELSERCLSRDTRVMINEDCMID